MRQGKAGPCLAATLLQDGLLEDGLALAGLDELLHVLLGRPLARHREHPPLDHVPAQDKATHQVNGMVGFTAHHSASRDHGNHQQLQPLSGCSPHDHALQTSDHSRMCAPTGDRQSSGMQQGRLQSVILPLLSDVQIEAGSTQVVRPQVKASQHIGVTEVLRPLQQQQQQHLYSSCRRWRRSWNSPIRSFSFLRSAAVMAVRVRSLLLPTPHPCRMQPRPFGKVYGHGVA